MKATEDIITLSWYKTNFCDFELCFPDIKTIKIVIFKTDLPYHIDRLFRHEYLRSNTVLKMQLDFKCIFYPKWTNPSGQKYHELLNILKIYFQHSLLCIK